MCVSVYVFMLECMCACVSVCVGTSLPHQYLSGRNLEDPVLFTAIGQQIRWDRGSGALPPVETQQLGGGHGGDQTL